MTTEQTKPAGDSPKGVALRVNLSLGLEPHNDTRQQLINWPAQPFTPDFIVVTSGLAQIELAGKLLGTKEGQVVTIAKGQEDAEVNCWWPDYIGGFALNLGRAVQALAEGSGQTRAKMIDEPVALLFHRQPGRSKIAVSFETDGKMILTSELPEAELRAQISRCLDDFYEQLLRLNYKLARQTDIQELKLLVQKLVS
jgi:hypothetical protein